MGLLDNRTVYAKSWEETSREEFTAEDKASIEEIEVVAANYGKSARVSKKSGYIFFSLSRESQELPIGTMLDKEKCMIVHLHRGSDQFVDKLLYLGDE